MKMSSFKEAIVFRCMGSSEMWDTIYWKKISNGNIFTTIVRIECFDCFIKMFFHNGFESNNNIFDIRFMNKMIEPNVSGEMVHKNYIIFKTIGGSDLRCPNIRKNRSSGELEIIVDWAKESLWLLLLRHALHENYKLMDWKSQFYYGKQFVSEWKTLDVLIYDATRTKLF